MKAPRLFSRRLLCTIGFSLAAVPAAWADAKYPDRPVKLVVALPAGGGVDTIARLVGQRLATDWGQPFVVDNRAGASGRIGLPVAAKATPDGYTLTVSPASFLTTNKSIFKSLPYDPQADFMPISKLANQDMVLVVRDRQKFPNVAAVLAAAKRNPSGLTYASSGDGSPQHLAALMFETRTQSRMTHVPYKGGALAINDLLGGNVDLLFAPLPEALPHLQSGKLSALGIMSSKRSALLPDTPTMREGGVDNMIFATWIGLLAPAHTPRTIVDRLNRQVRSTLENAEVKSRLRDIGMEAAPTTPEQLQQTIAKEIQLHAELVKAAGLEPQ